ncbi:cytochrome P450 71A1-like [Prunus yedoensis var. nudiflora]|uniref:Cytochrome P450 71A1-like n=1 Tax=Prunus yedoensis var. nudiflora TaxID=2094558 RepID=A0A314Y8R9_PRUYE|nr:cytochrome P450 71A1-like [Prunus yedoensis var. nudiflora]
MGVLVPHLHQVWLELHRNLTIDTFLFLALLFSFFVLLIFTKSRGKLNLPPSPPRLPIIRNLHQVGTLPHRSLRAVSKKYGPLLLMHLGRAPTLVVSSAEFAKEIMRTHDIVFSNRIKTTAEDILYFGCKDIGSASCGDYWRQVRKLCVVELLSQRHFQYVPFGGGRRACPELTFGIVTVEFVIANLLYWFDWKLPGEGAMGRDLDMSEVNGLTVHKEIHLHLVPIPYSSIHHLRDIVDDYVVSTPAQ